MVCNAPITLIQTNNKNQLHLFLVEFQPPVWRLLILRKVSCFTFIFLLFITEYVEMACLTSIWSGQQPNTGQHIQQAILKLVATRFVYQKFCNWSQCDNKGFKDLWQHFSAVNLMFTLHQIFTTRTFFYCQLFNTHI